MKTSSLPLLRQHAEAIPHIPQSQQRNEISADPLNHMYTVLSIQHKTASGVDACVQKALTRFWTAMSYHALATMLLTSRTQLIFFLLYQRSKELLSHPWTTEKVAQACMCCTCNQTLFSRISILCWFSKSWPSLNIDMVMSDSFCGTINFFWEVLQVLLPNPFLFWCVGCLLLTCKSWL